MNQEPNPRQELCDRFRADLLRPVSDRYFSEDELIEIFDYAGDINDDYLRSEALFLGARLYPDSIPLRERRAIFYLFFDEEVFKKYLADNPDIDTPIWQIMRLNILPHNCPETIREIEKFLEGISEFEDEEIIQLVQTISSLQLNQWLFDNLDKLRSRCTYLPTLLYEVAVNAEMSNNYERAITLLEELTEIEPYTTDYWTMLATCYLMTGKTSDAATALDYALAIEPDNMDALRARLGTLDYVRDSEKFREIIDRIMTANPADDSIACLAIEQGMHTDDRAYVMSILDRAAATCAASGQLVRHAIEMEYPGVEKMLEAYFDSGKGDNDEWMQLAETAYDAQATAALASILKVYESKTGGTLDHDMLMYKILYRVKNYDVVVNMFLNVNLSGSLREADNMYDAFSRFIMSLLRLGRFDDAHSAADNMVTLLDNEPALPGDVYRKYALRSFLADVVSRISSEKDTTDWNNYDPLNLDKA